MIFTVRFGAAPWLTSTKVSRMDVSSCRTISPVSSTRPSMSCSPTSRSYCLPSG